MKRWAALLLVMFAVVLGSTGCGGEREKGQNKDKDKPQPEATK